MIRQENEDGDKILHFIREEKALEIPVSAKLEVRVNLKAILNLKPLPVLIVLFKNSFRKLHSLYQFNLRKNRFI